MGLVCAGGMWPASSEAGSSPKSIAQVAAAFVYQFTRYVEWPEESFERTDDAFVIAVVDDPELSEALSRLVADKGQDGRSFRVLAVERAADLTFAHIVFLGGDREPAAALSTGLAFEGHALTVSDHEMFTREGGMLRLYEESNRLRIEVNIDAARRSHLKISSKLLDLARIVHDEAD